MQAFFEYIAARVPWGWLAIFFYALAGRMVYHTAQVQRHRRRFFSRELLLELPIVVGMGVMGYGACALFHINGEAQAVVISLAGYLGPYGLNALWGVWLAKQRPSAEAETEKPEAEK